MRGEKTLADLAQQFDVQDKQITELHLDQTEQPFPGLMAIASRLSVIGELPPGSVQRLVDARAGSISSPARAPASFTSARRKLQ